MKRRLCFLSGFCFWFFSFFGCLLFFFLIIRGWFVFLGGSTFVAKKWREKIFNRIVIKFMHDLKNLGPQDFFKIPKERN